MNGQIFDGAYGCVLIQKYDTEYMDDENCINDIQVGLELNLLTQEQVVSEFRALVSKDLAMAALQYDQFAAKLEDAAFNGNAQVRSLAGGPDSFLRAQLVDVMVGNYATASDEVKEKILDHTLSPLMGDNSFYVSLAVARMKNPYVIGDIIRKHPLYNPGLDIYEEDLLMGNNLSGPGDIQKWLEYIGTDNYFAATALALQTSHATDITTVMEANKPLFDGAAHIVAAYHDSFAERKIARDPSLNKAQLLRKYRSGFVKDFATIVSEKAEEANWLEAWI